MHVGPDWDVTLACELVEHHGSGRRLRLSLVLRTTRPGTSIVYNYPQTGDDPKWHWTTKSYTDRLGYPTEFTYLDPDATNNIQTTVMSLATGAPVASLL
ncbi:MULTISPECIES: hypothetical protein [Micromonospora]|uniref:Uncharacterized protein n=1 Tax=Micromonospora sicca TaxID=2202420 RepID=A0A317DL61_9ACTN|nr:MULTISPECIES: hypothetical protein [unclassified Micromonospora]MBM0224575.1 hypothetical protein [Micromonospora sp. ATA51]PWR15348.1 hypothetical protein DKT69_11370 [Micromonospora sp. 4G51]